jgi:saccharopine dehydrogenase-like NADP-dependent oxidoreductase
MRILMVGAGGVGSAAARIAARRSFFASFVVTDYDQTRAAGVVADLADSRFTAAGVNAANVADVERLAREHGATHVFNAVDPRFVLPVFNGALAAGADYLDTALSLSAPHPDRPYSEVGVKLGDEQFAAAGECERRGRLALLGIGVSPRAPGPAPQTLGPDALAPRPSLDKLVECGSPWGHREPQAGAPPGEHGGRHGASPG